MNKEFIIDISGNRTKEEITQRFSDVLGLGYTRGSNWDAFYDDMTSLPTQSSVIGDIRNTVYEVHLFIKGYNSILELSDTDRLTFLEILVGITDRRKNGGLKLTFEVEE